MKEVIRFVKAFVATAVVVVSLSAGLEHSIMWDKPFVPTTNQLSICGILFFWVWILFIGYCVFEFFDKMFSK